MTTTAPYSVTRRAGELLFVSGLVPRKDGATVPGSIDVQTRQVLSNLDAVLAQNGAHRAQVVKTTVLLKDMEDWAAMNVPYLEYFGAGPLPARTAFAVGLGPGFLVEIDAVVDLTVR